MVILWILSTASSLRTIILHGGLATTRYRDSFTWLYYCHRLHHHRYSARSLVSRIPEVTKTESSQLAVLIQVLELLRQWERQNGNLKDIYTLLHQSRWNSALAPLIAVLQGIKRLVLSETLDLLDTSRDINVTRMCLHFCQL